MTTGDIPLGLVPSDEHHHAGCRPRLRAEAVALAHRHNWRYDGQLPDASLLYHCDGHMPPLAFVVSTEPSRKTGQRCLDHTREEHDLAAVERFKSGAWPK